MRKATPDDLLTILEMVVDYYIANQSVNKHGVDFDVGKAKLYINGMLTAPEGICYISDDHNGIVLGHLMAPWFGHRMFANGYVLYVRPQARNGLLARSLLKHFEEEAQARGAYVSWEFYNDTHRQLIDGLMVKLGYQQNGHIFTKDTKEG